MTDNTRNSSRLDPASLFGDEQRLALHQLRLLDWWIEANQRKDLSPARVQEGVPQVAVEIPEIWNLTKGIQPHRWQQECISEDGGRKDEAR